MLKYFLFAASLTLAINILLVRCANIQPPTGGPKDITPPQIRRVIPADKTVNFKGRGIEIQFNEDISQFGQELLITPFYSKKVQIHVVRNKVKILFQELDTNTTYTINFREQVKDITEKNSLVNYTFTFSTGPHMDSLSVSGKVIDLMTDQPIPGALISLYRQKDTTTISKDKPYYLSETSKTGDFIINNVKGGNYRIYALKDNNNTINYDTENDLIDFDTISLTKSISDLVFKVSQIDTTAPKIIHENEENENTFLIRFTEGVKNLSVTCKDKPFKLLLSDDARDVKIYNYNTQPYNDSLALVVYASDSLGNADTSKLKVFFEQEAKKKENHNKDKEKQDKENAHVINKVFPTDKNLNPDSIDIKIYLNDPWKEINLDSLILIEDSIPVTLTKKEITKNEETGLIQIKKVNRAKDSVLLKLNKGLFITITDDTSSKQKIKFKIKKEEDVGSLSGIVKTKEESYIFQLLDSKYKPIASIRNPHKFEFKYLTPGSYYIRILVDKNNNGRWDQASLKNNIKAEPVFFYKEKLELRANWEIQDTVIEF